YFARIAQADAVRSLIERAGQNQAPETIDGARRLPVLLEPIVKRRILVCVIALQTVQTVDDAGFFGCRQELSAGETADQMKRRRPVIAAESADVTIRRHEIEAALRRQQMIDADGAAKMREVGATAHADMLAGVDELAGRGVLKGTRPAAQAIA